MFESELEGVSMGIKVLIVDDSAVVAAQLSQIVEAADDVEIVGHARDGLEALKLVQQTRPDLVFMDIVMPKLDGLNALRLIRSMGVPSRVVMVSSVGGMGDRVEEAIKLGAHSVISKPFDEQQIRAVLQELGSLE